MTEVVRLQGRILQVRHVDRGESVGYGASHLMVRPGRIATVAVGYADGYPRSASGRARALIAGVQVPQVGRVSMDMTTFDVTDIPAEGARPGAFLTLIGGPYSLDHLAEDSGTIAYEILTRLGARYARHYSGGPTP
jgi:alanine racemase